MNASVDRDPARKYCSDDETFARMAMALNDLELEYAVAQLAETRVPRRLLPLEFTVHIVKAQIAMARYAQLAAAPGEDVLAVARRLAERQAKLSPGAAAQWAELTVAWVLLSEDEL